MKIVLAAGGLVVALTLSGCGDSPHPSVQPDLAGKPTWGGCREFISGTMDFVVDAPGAKSRSAAIAHYRLAGDHVVTRPARAHRNAQVLLVDEHDVIDHALELIHTDNGWLVSTVESCGD
jgi:hypothetical protein